MKVGVTMFRVKKGLSILRTDECSILEYIASACVQQLSNPIQSIVGNLWLIRLQAGSLEDECKVTRTASRGQPKKVDKLEGGWQYSTRCS